MTKRGVRGSHIIFTEFHRKLQYYSAWSRHMTHEIKSDTAMISKNTRLIKEYTAGLTKQLDKQDEILKQIAWLRAVVSKENL